MRLILGTLIACLMFANTVSANITNDASQTIELEFVGTIEPLCKVNARIRNRSIQLDLSSSTRQNTSNIRIWCNTGQSNATATYSSVNGGYLVNDAGNQIPYLMRIPKTTGNVALTSPVEVQQRAGSGIAGDHKGRVIQITPQVNGFEYAGVYRDTISVTVAVN